MKKLIIFSALAFIGFTTVQAQQFKAGISAALPIGDFDEANSFGLQAEFMYLFDVLEGVQVGPIAGVSHYFGKDSEISFGGVTTTVEGQDVTFLPIGATGRVMLGDSFMLGADLGYALGLAPDGNDGGFHYKPRIGYQLNEKVMLGLAYSGVSLDGATFNAISIGAEFGF